MKSVIVAPSFYKLRMLGNKVLKRGQYTPTQSYRKSYPSPECALENDCMYIAYVLFFRCQEA